MKTKKFWALNKWKLRLGMETVVGVKGFATPAEAEHYGREQAEKYGDHIFSRVVNACNYNEARAQCRG